MKNLEVEEFDSKRIEIKRYEIEREGARIYAEEQRLA
jgi:hypothetical protein